MPFGCCSNQHHPSKQREDENSDGNNETWSTSASSSSRNRASRNSSSSFLSSSSTLSSSTSSLERSNLISYHRKYRSFTFFKEKDSSEIILLHHTSFPPDNIVHRIGTKVSNPDGSCIEESKMINSHDLKNRLIKELNENNNHNYKLSSVDRCSNENQKDRSTNLLNSNYKSTTTLIESINKSVSSSNLTNKQTINYKSTNKSIKSFNSIDDNLVDSTNFLNINFNDFKKSKIVNSQLKPDLCDSVHKNRSKTSNNKTKHYLNKTGNNKKKLLKSTSSKSINHVEDRTNNNRSNSNQKSKMDSNKVELFKSKFPIQFQNAATNTDISNNKKGRFRNRVKNND